MRLYFLRHGLAGDREEWQGNDSERPLTEEGKKRMTEEAASLAKLHLDLEVIITSPLVRAFQTADIVARHLKMTDHLVTDARLSPGFGVDQLKELLPEHAKASALMLVGHEPDFSDTVGQLIGGGRVVCKKGGLACVELSSTSTLKGELLWLLPPKLLTM